MNIKGLISWIFLFLGYFSVQAQNFNLKVENFVLENGFTVLLNYDESAKDVFGAVVVKAGSKNDPADATGLAHYLEHLLFKGTSELGTLDYQKEKPFLDSIYFYYDALGKTRNIKERENIQKLINNQSIKAAEYALPTEFDKLIKNIGGTNLNAFTTADMTVYLNSFPGNQIEKWLELYSHRFINPVFRSFQSELEVVYEEKNRSMDGFETKIFDDINKNLFKNHPYGTQTTIGSSEHLKNPSLTRINQFYEKYYVAANMALVLSGNFDKEEAKNFIKEKFSKLRTAKVPEFPKYPPTIFTKKEVLKVRYTPVKVDLLGFKTIPSVHPDKPALDIFNYLLYNEAETGKLNKLQRENKLLYSGIFNNTYNDDGASIIFIVPKLIGQSFQAAEKLVFNEIQKIKNGEFTDNELEILKLELYRHHQQGLEQLESRVFNMVETINQGISWDDHLNYPSEINKITKDDVIRVANKYYGENYLCIQSKTGFPKKETLKKPGFLPNTAAQKEESAFAKKFNAIKVKERPSKFLDFNKDVVTSILNSGESLYTIPNRVNDIFSFKIEFKIGSDSIKNLDLASNFFTYIHTNDMSLDKIKEAFAILGSTYYSNCSRDRFTIELTGLESNFEKSFNLLINLINGATGDEKGIKALQNSIITERKAEGKVPAVNGRAMLEYGKYGKDSEYLARIPLKALKKIEAEFLIKKLNQAKGFEASYHYAGNMEPMELKKIIEPKIETEKIKPKFDLRDRPIKNISENTILFINDKKAVQSQVYFIINGSPYSATSVEDATIRAFNHYMDGDFSGLIMQEIREYRSLAYSAWGTYAKPNNKNSAGNFYSFIGCQADKTIEAVETMHGLLTAMPEKPERIGDIKALLKNSVNSNYPDFRNVSGTIETLKQHGYNSDPLINEFDAYGDLSFNSIMDFYTRTFKDKPVLITIYGNKKMVDLKSLSKFGKIVKLKRNQIMTN